MTDTESRDWVIDRIDTTGWLTTDDVVDIVVALLKHLDENGFTSSDIESIPVRALSRFMEESGRDAEGIPPTGEEV
jgi:hypothetical protein